jgi:hypothetical protein
MDLTKMKLIVKGLNPDKFTKSNEDELTTGRRIKDEPANPYN